MQWLIDIIKAWIVAEGYIKTSFVDRGDPAAWDYTLNDFTRDAAWHDLDLSGIVPAGAKAIAVFMKIKSNVVGSNLRLRTNGNVNTSNLTELKTQVANVIISFDVVTIPDGNRVVEYYASLAVWTDISLIVKGWWV